MKVKCILRATFQSSISCPSKTCKGNVTDAGGNGEVCDSCPKRVNMLVAKKKIEGEIDVNDLSLSVDMDYICDIR